MGGLDGADHGRVHGHTASGARGNEGIAVACGDDDQRPESLSVAAALHPKVSDAPVRAQQDTLSEIRRWLGQHSVTRVGPRDAREVISIQGMQVVGMGHEANRAGEPHRHIHMQIGTRVWTAGKCGALLRGASVVYTGQTGMTQGTGQRNRLFRGKKLPRK